MALYFHVVKFLHEVLDRYLRTTAPLSSLSATAACFELSHGPRVQPFGQLGVPSLKLQKIFRTGPPFPAHQPGFLLGTLTSSKYTMF